NPNNETCPDFTGPDFLQARTDFQSDTVTDAQAAEILEKAWKANNTSQRAIWQRRADDDAAAAKAIEEQAVQAEAARAEELAKDLEIARRDEIKKNKEKFLPIPDRPPPSHSVIRVRPWALNRMSKGKYCPLWYWTPAGLDDSEHDCIDDDAMVISHVDGISSFMPAASAKESRAAVADADLTWEEFSQAVPRYVLAM
ncbi:hypothetical protein BDZ97DRAFT_1602459, partial [Flammula alnicola]